MIIYETKTQKYQVVSKVICDKCHAEYCMPDDEMDLQEFLYIGFTGGYGSVFGDTSEVKGDFCQNCTKELLGKYLYVDGFIR